MNPLIAATAAAFRGHGLQAMLTFTAMNFKKQLIRHGQIQ